MNTATAFALPLPARPKADAARFNAHLLNVTFEAVDGERRSALGGAWTLVRWSPLFGE